MKLKKLFLMPLLCSYLLANSNGVADNSNDINSTLLEHESKINSNVSSINEISVEVQKQSYILRNFNDTVTAKVLDRINGLMVDKDVAIKTIASQTSKNTIMINESKEIIINQMVLLNEQKELSKINSDKIKLLEESNKELFTKLKNLESKLTITKDTTNTINTTKETTPQLDETKLSNPNENKSVEKVDVSQVLNPTTKKVEVKKSLVKSNELQSKKVEVKKDNKIIKKDNKIVKKENTIVNKIEETKTPIIENKIVENVEKKEEIKEIVKPIIEEVKPIEIKKEIPKVEEVEVKQEVLAPMSAKPTIIEEERKVN